MLRRQLIACNLEESDGPFFLMTINQKGEFKNNFQIFH